MLDHLRGVIRFLSAHPLTRDHRAAALLRFFVWQLESRLRREVIVRWIGGTRLAARRGMTGATGNIYAGLHEFVDMAFTLHFLRPGDVFMDIGANIGSYTVLASGVGRANTIAIEPDPETMELLRRNVDLNELNDLVVLEQVALGAENGEAMFTIGLDTINHVAREGVAQSRRVRLKTLDEVGYSRPPTLIKIDVEGYEAEVFRGGTSVLNSASLKAVITEGQTAEAIAPLSKAGFTQFYYDPFERSLGRAMHYNSSNALFVRDAPFVATRLTSSPSFHVLGAVV